MRRTISIPAKLARGVRLRHAVVSLATLSAIVAAPALLSGEAPPFRPPDFDAKVAALRKAGPDLVPLFILGDVNEDGAVDERDAELVRRLAQPGVEPKPAGEISCPAAADLDQNGEINQRDLDLILGWGKAGAVATPALSFQSYLPCNFKQFFIAASKLAQPGGSFAIRFLAPELTTANASVRVDGGNAQVRRVPDRRGYIVTAPPTGKAGDTIVLRIELPKSRAYFYTVEVGRLAR
jgi:hypothetical protein